MSSTDAETSHLDLILTCVPDSHTDFTSNQGCVAMQDRSQPVLSSASVIGWETRPVLILATGREFTARPKSQRSGSLFHLMHHFTESHCSVNWCLIHHVFAVFVDTTSLVRTRTSTALKHGSDYLELLAGKHVPMLACYLSKRLLKTRHYMNTVFIFYTFSWI